MVCFFGWMLHRLKSDSWFSLPLTCLLPILCQFIRHRNPTSHGRISAAIKPCLLCLILRSFSRVFSSFSFLLNLPYLSAVLSAHLSLSFQTLLYKLKTERKDILQPWFREQLNIFFVLFSFIICLFSWPFTSLNTCMKELPWISSAFFKPLSVV